MPPGLSESASVTYRIRAARLSDLPRLAPIERAAVQLLLDFGMKGAVSVVPLAEHAAAYRQRRLLVAVDGDDEPVGFAVMQEHAGVGHLHEMDVHPEHGRRGVGTRLLQRCLGWARERGLPAMTLTTFREVPWNAPFYARHGFVEVLKGEWTGAMTDRARREGVRDDGVRLLMRAETGAVAGGDMLHGPGVRPWCMRCWRSGDTCLCSEIGRLRTRTKFVFLTHPREARKTKNGSGLMTHLALEGSERLIGIDFSRDRRVGELLADPTYCCRLLYPDTPGGAATEWEGGGEATPVLFLIDGTWPCAKKMMRLSANLHGLPRLSLDVDRPSEFVIKQQPDPRCLATVEAVDRTLHLLASRGEEAWSQEDSQTLLRPFHRMNAMALEAAADPARPSYRTHGGYKAPEQRKPRKKRDGSGRRIVFGG